MTTFANVDAHLGRIPADIGMMLREIDQAQGRQEAFRLQHPQSLEALTQVARIQSTEASNAIEGITAPRARIKALVAGDATPRNRSEAEIAGYRKVLDLIHSTSPDAIDFTANIVRQLHRMLFELTPRPGAHGRFKPVDNTVEEVLPDGTRRIRFQPVPAWATEDAMRTLHNGYTSCAESGRYHPLLLTASYVLDFTVIHPFSDGNGRMSRLLTSQLLYRHGYEVGRFVSLERVIAETKETYYESVAAATMGWHTAEHDVYPWIRYFLGVLIAAYAEFEARVGTLGGRGSKREAVRQFVRSSLADTFRLDDVRHACPGVSDDHIRNVLAELRGEGVLSAATRGRGATYRRLTTDF